MLVCQGLTLMASVDFGEIVLTALFLLSTDRQTADQKGESDHEDEDHSFVLYNIEHQGGL